MTLLTRPSVSAPPSRRFWTNERSAKIAGALLQYQVDNLGIDYIDKRNQMVEAITVDKATGAKVVFADTCVGCKVCTIACPFGTVNYVHDTGKVQKCDLCGGDPACATACPTGAITYVDADWTGLDKMRQWAAKTDTQASAGA